MMLGQRDLRAKASMQCLSGLVNEPYFVLFSSVGFNFKVLTLGRLGLASHLSHKRAVPASLAQVLRASARFAPMGGGEGKRLRMADGRALRPRVASPALPTYSPAAGPFGEGGGRSKRGLPILWEPPSGGDMRGRLWMTSPGGVRRGEGAGARAGSALAGDAGSKRRRGDST
jgi:hypothetical protein